MTTDLQKGEAAAFLEYGLRNMTLLDEMLWGVPVILSIDASFRVQRLGDGGTLTSSDIIVDDVTTCRLSSSSSTTPRVARHVAHSSRSFEVFP
ncbi:hypothetical protein B0H16DRAFT_1718475 [Mycena metata]|uniref:Uncharacterized protein n=1 Tax=Mycena metata TaxID=1033252 RepID=A0AAD7JI23_9AGAR|nr:hypothetical protein B0H16DRAFT_1718475 [Mycena metata]